MAGILRIFCGCLQDKMHCLVLYSSPRDWAVFPSGTKVGHNKQVLTINFSQPQCYVFKIRRLKNVLGRVSLSNRLPAKPKLNVRRVQMGQACVEHDHFENTPTFLWSMGQWELFDGSKAKGNVLSCETHHCSTTFCCIKLTISKRSLPNTDCCHYKFIVCYNMTMAHCSA